MTFVQKELKKVWNYEFHDAVYTGWPARDLVNEHVSGMHVLKSQTV
jgi:hypothetical protein